MRKALLAIFILFSFNLYGAGAKIDIPKYDWSWKGFFGTYDRASAQRGLKVYRDCLLYTSPSPRDLSTSRMPSSA